MAKEQLSLAEFPEFDKERYSDPEYLCQCRWLANRALISTKGTAQAERVVKWIQAMGISHRNRREGILFEEEVELILKHNLVYPQPWTTDRCLVDIPEKYDSTLGLFNISIPSWAEQGHIIGIASGACDIYHAGYSLYFHACKDMCKVFVFGIDDNELAAFNRDPSRPFNDFPIRIGTLSGAPEIDYLFGIDLIDIKTQLACRPYVLAFFQIPGKPFNLENLEEIIEQGKKENAHWYERVGLNLRFFWTEGDPAADFKRAGAELFGAQGIEIPRLTSLTSTKIGKHFGVEKRDDQRNSFGVPPYWLRSYLSLAEKI